MKKQKRNRLEGAIRNEPAQSNRRLLAKYGMVHHGINIVSHWQDVFLNRKRNEKGQVVLNEHERSFLVNEFLHGLFLLDWWHFEQMARAIKLYLSRLSTKEREKVIATALSSNFALTDSGKKSFAERIRSFEKTPADDRLRYKLNSVEFWLVNPPLTHAQIEERVGEKVPTKLLNELGVPWQKSKGGRPRKLPPNKRSKRR